MESPPLVPASPAHSRSITARWLHDIATAGPSRLAWLDALRGIAALVVVFDHSSYTFMPEFRRELMPQFNTSRYGIMVFFLVSGYIIPASLERRGCVRTFWVGRIFRMYPLWAAVVTVRPRRSTSRASRSCVTSVGQSAVAVAVAHVTMLQELLGTPNLLLVLWTLSYEMSFYLLVVALFTVRLHRRSAAVAGHPGRARRRERDGGVRAAGLRSVRPGRHRPADRARLDRPGGGHLLRERRVTRASRVRGRAGRGAGARPGPASTARSRCGRAW